MTDIAASNHRAREGEEVAITAKVANTGTAPAASKAESLLDGATSLGLVDTPRFPRAAGRAHGASPTRRSKSWNRGSVRMLSSVGSTLRVTT